MQTQTARQLRVGRYGTALIVAIAGTALLLAVAIGVIVMTGNDAAPAASIDDTVQVYEDPPLPAGWRDSYFMPKSGAYTEDPPLPAGWSDPYFERSAGEYTEDPPLPEGWIDPYFSGVYTSGD